MSLLSSSTYNCSSSTAGTSDVLSGDGSVDLIIEDQISKQQDTQSTGLHSTTIPAPKLNRENTSNMLTSAKESSQKSWETEKMITTSTATTQPLTTSTTTTTQSVTTNRSTSISDPPKAPKPQHNATSAARKHTVKSRLSWNEESVATTDSPKNSGRFKLFYTMVYIWTCTDITFYVIKMLNYSMCLDFIEQFTIWSQHNFKTIFF